MDYPNSENSNTKHIIIEDLQKNKNMKNTKKINCEKERKMRVETQTWGLNEEQLSRETQLNILECIKNETLEQNEKDENIKIRIIEKEETQVDNEKKYDNHNDNDIKDVYHELVKEINGE